MRMEKSNPPPISSHPKFNIDKNLNEHVKYIVTNYNDTNLDVFFFESTYTLIAHNLNL